MQISEPFKRLQPVLASFVDSNDTQPVCEFVGASRKSVRRWAANSHPAKGGNEIRLWHFLLAAGYEFPDLAIDKFNFYIAQLFAYSVVSLEEASQLCGVKNDQTTLQIMRGQPPMHPSLTIEQLREMYDDQLQAKIGEVSQSVCPQVQSVLPDLPVASDDVEALSPAFNTLVEVLANQLMSVLPMTELALESMTPEQRARLRELVGDQRMFTLSNNLNALCSERARAKQGRR